MKKILSSPDIGEIAQLKSLLEGSGIACFMRNEISSGLSQEIPLTESTPELWIQNDQDLAEALQLKAASKTSLPVAGHDWTCQTCGENSGAQFTSCWKCGATKP